MERTEAEVRSLLTASAWGLAIQLVAQLAIGIALSFRYHADPALAHTSVSSMHEGGLFGFLQATHYWGSAIFILHSVLHLGVATWRGLYRVDRVAFVTALLFLLCALGFQLTGNVLPYDRHGVQTAGIEAGIAARAPLVGGQMANMLLGGNGFNEQTLARWYFLHRWGLPLLALLTLGLWLRSRRPIARRWIAVAPVALSALLGLAVRSPFGSAATPADYEQYNARVSWYVWPLHGAMRLFEQLGSGFGWVGSILLPGLLLLFLLSLVLLRDRVSHRVVQGVLVAAVALLAVGALCFGGSFAPLVGKRNPVDAASNGTPVKSDPTDKDLAKRGQEAFNRLPCADCHGKNGAEAGGGPALTRAWQRHSDADYYIRYIRNPSAVQPSSTMPAFPKLSDGEVRALAEFLRSPK